MLLLAMGLVDLAAGIMLFNTGDLGFFLSLALFIKGGMSVMGSELFHAAGGM
ncbi:MAG: hypothetical protein ACP5O3_02510 [Candidatus Micrarchaeia archaeon]|jgi:hypothetical protein